MICLAGLIIFSILGIFSLSYRKLAKEAFDCVFRRMTLRPCKSGFDQKMKAKIVGKLLTRNIRIARFVQQRLEILSWVFVIFFFASLIISVKSIYNLVRYQTCNPAQPQSCVILPQKRDACICREGQVICEEEKQSSCQEGECGHCEGCQN